MITGHEATVYGIGVGPGDPGGVTVRGAELFGRCRRVMAPRAPGAGESLALGIVRRHLRPDAVVEELDFPMSPDPAVLAAHWDAAADRVLAAVDDGDDVAFPTLGDVSMYSTFGYLARALRAKRPGIGIRLVPGVTSVHAAAAATGFVLGEGKAPIVILPAGDAEQFRRALDFAGTVAVMKIGARLPALLDELERRGLVGSAVLARRVGLEDEELWTDLGSLSAEERGRAGYLSVLLARGAPGGGEA